MIFGKDKGKLGSKKSDEIIRGGSRKEGQLLETHRIVGMCVIWGEKKSRVSHPVVRHVGNRKKASELVVKQSIGTKNAQNGASEYFSANTSFLKESNRWCALTSKTTKPKRNQNVKQ